MRRDKDCELEVPKAIIKRLVYEILLSHKKKTYRLEKKAIKILHHDSEKYITEIFMISNVMATVSKRHTVYPLFFKNATKIHNALVHG